MEIDFATIIITVLAVLCFAVPIGYDQLRNKSNKEEGKTE
jgi:hypothetical protein